MMFPEKGWNVDEWNSSKIEQAIHPTGEINPNAVRVQIK